MMRAYNCLFILILFDCKRFYTADVFSSYAFLMSFYYVTTFVRTLHI